MILASAQRSRTGATGWVGRQRLYSPPTYRTAKAGDGVSFDVQAGGMVGCTFPRPGRVACLAYPAPAIGVVFLGLARFVRSKSVARRGGTESGRGEACPWPPGGRCCPAVDRTWACKPYWWLVVGGWIGWRADPMISFAVGAGESPLGALSVRWRGQPTASNKEAE
jgi:hypothetical protein